MSQEPEPITRTKKFDAEMFRPPILDAPFTLDTIATLFGKVSAEQEDENELVRQQYSEQRAENRKLRLLCHALYNSRALTSEQTETMNRIEDILRE